MQIFSRKMNDQQKTLIALPRKFAIFAAQEESRGEKRQNYTYTIKMITKTLMPDVF
jgi:hypothetical protein